MQQKKSIAPGDLCVQGNRIGRVVTGFSPAVWEMGHDWATPGDGVRGEPVRGQREPEPRLHLAFVNRRANVL